MDGRPFESRVNSVISWQPTASFTCSAERKCFQTDEVITSNAMFSNQGKCSALLTREGFFDFVIFRTPCNVSHPVAIVCQHEHKKSIAFNNNISDIKVSIVDGYYSLQEFSSCDAGWFMVDNMCINLYQCQNCTDNSEAHGKCVAHGGQLAYHALTNVSLIAPGNILSNNSCLSLFFGMFYHKEDLKVNIFNGRYPYTVTSLAVNGSAMCVTYDISNQCKDNNGALIVHYYDIGHLPSLEWSVIDHINFVMAQFIDFSLCEKSRLNITVLTNCSDLYMVCDDGTCVHDSLVCDGEPHCLHGEDEAECPHICSDNTHTCISHCHHRDFCTCSPQYFQCLSGGCVPLQKLCDKIKHCIDASDEPATCVYLRPEQLGLSSLPLDINNYISNLIQQNKAKQHKCFQYETLLSFQVNYEMHRNEQHCAPSSSSSDMKFHCNVLYVDNKIPEEYFTLERLCIYDHDCDGNNTSNCFNRIHLLKCEHMYCVARFKCPASYCVSFDYICNNVCDCPHCEDESICNKLLCPGMVLIPQIESGFRCSRNATSLKHSLHMRQIIYRKGLDLSDDFPILIYLEDVDDVASYVVTPEVVVYCTIQHSNFDITDVKLFHWMVSVRRLLLPHNGIQKLSDSIFASMSQLIVLDLSHNFITYLSQNTLCALQNLEYISLHHNLISNLQVATFVYSPHLQVLLLESNDLSPQSVVIDGTLHSLYRLSSDIPRLCCTFDKATYCSPPFPLLVSCSNLITSKVLIVLGWIIGLSIFVLGLICLILLTIKHFSSDKQTPAKVRFLSVNLSLAELVTSFCLLSYSVINVVYEDTFGVIADHWRHSWKCLGLESTFSVSSRASLAFAVCLSLHFAIHIPSIIRREYNWKTTFFQITIVWLLITSTCIAVQIVEHMQGSDPYNYFCFPFTTLFPSDPLILGLQIVMVMLDNLLVMVCVISYGYLLVFTIRKRRNKTLQSISKRKGKLQKLGARLTVLLLSTVLTWIPILTVQILVLIKITISPNIYFWCICVSFPVNLIIDPILLIRNMLA